MKTLSVGEFKANFSDIISDLFAGNEVAVTYGKKKVTIGVLIPYSAYKKEAAKRKLGILEGKASFRIKPGFKMTIEEFLRS